MNTPFSDLNSTLSRCQQATDQLMSRPLSDPDWAERAAEKLLALAPPARIALCHLTTVEPSGTAVRTADGLALPDWSEALGVEVRRLEGVEGKVHQAPDLGSVFGLHCLAAAPRDDRGPWALLVLGAQVDASPDVLGLVEAVLAACSHSLSLWRRLEAVRRERDEFAGFALAGQATVALAHELNNLLNGMTLQASVVQLQVDEKFHAALDVIRRQANMATGLLRPLGQVSAERARSAYPVDVGRAVQEVLRERPALAARVHFSPAATSLPSIRAVSSAVKQLIALLLSGASAGAPSPLRVRTEQHGDGVVLRIEGEVVPGYAGRSAQPLNAEAVLWDRLADLERLAGQSLLRQLGGRLKVEARPQGGFTLRVGWS